MSSSLLFKLCRWKAKRHDKCFCAGLLVRTFFELDPRVTLLMGRIARDAHEEYGRPPVRAKEREATERAVEAGRPNPRHLPDEGLTLLKSSFYVAERKRLTEVGQFGKHDVEWSHSQFATEPNANLQQPKNRSCPREGTRD